MDDDEFAAILAGAEAFDKAADKERAKFKRKKRKRWGESGNKQPYKRPMSKREFSDLEKCKRNEGLNTRIGSDNKGFKLLAQMGYKPGMGLGTNGIKEPVEIVMRPKKIGLGKYEEMKKREEAKRKLEVERMRTQIRAGIMMQSNFKKDRSQALITKKVRRQCKKSKAVCEELDRKAGITVNPWLIWEEKETEAKAEEPESEKRPTKTIRLGEVDLDDHEVWSSPAFGDGLFPRRCSPSPPPPEEEEPNPFNAMPYEELAPILDNHVKYLRQFHMYCFWCAAKYKNEDELERYCPGLLPDDHDSLHDFD